MNQPTRSSGGPKGSTARTVDLAARVPRAPANDTTTLPPSLLALLDDLATLIARLAHEERLDDLAPPELTSDENVPADLPEKVPHSP